MTEAIQQDVSQLDRDADLDEIAERLMQERDGGQEEIEETEEVEETEEQEESESQEEELSESESEEPSEDVPEEETITLKVDGEEVQVPLSKVKDAGVRTLQKETAADKRLQEVSEREKFLQQREQQIAAWMQSQQPQQDAEDPLDKVVDAIQYGEKEDAKQALKTLLAQAPQGPSQDEILRTVEVRLHNQRIQDKFQASPEQGGFGDIAQDPMLYQMAAQYIDHARRSGDKRMGWEIYEEAGKKVRDWRDNLVGKQQVTTTLDEKKASKKKIDNVKTTSARQEKKEEKEPTRGDIIREMAASRAN